MSIQSEIDRIKGNVTDSLSAIRGTGVNVPDGSNSNDLPNLINNLANTRQRVVDLGTLSFSTHGSYENSAQLTEEQMDEIFLSDDPPVLLFAFNGQSEVDYVAIDLYKQTARFARSEVLIGSEWGLSASRMEIGYHSGFFEGPLIVLNYYNYFNGTSDEGALVAAKQIKLPSNPAQPMEAATKQYVDTKIGSINTLLDTINGEVV